MGTYSDIYKSAIEKIKARVEKNAKEAAKEAIRELIPDLSKDLKAAYASQDQSNPGAAKRWYDAYEPRYYRRNYSLYNIMEVNADAVEMKLRYSFTDNNMTKDRKGNSLFDHVFVYGWHGGAFDRESGQIRYRSPYQIYKYWGRKAVKTSSPYGLFMKRIPELEVQYKQKIRDLTIRKLAAKLGTD